MIFLAGIVPGSTLAVAPDNFIWTERDTGIAGSIIAGIAIDANTPTTIYALTQSTGVYKSVDGGTNWAVANTGLPSPKTVLASSIFGDLLTIDPNDPDVLYASFEGKVFKTADGAATWNESNTGIEVCAPNYQIAGILVDPQDSTHVLAGHVASGCSGGLFESSDSGANWARIDATGIGNDVWMLAIDPTDANNLYSATVHQSFLYSRDAGASWTKNPPAGALTGGTVVTVHPAVVSRIFYGDGSGLYRSDDSALTWSDLTAQVGDYVYDVKFAASDTDIGYVASDGGVFKTVDGGITWNSIGAHADKAPRVLEIDPTDSDIVYLGSSGTGMYKSTDGGVNFNAVNTGLPVSIFAVSTAIAPSNPNVYYAAINALGFFRSTDRGNTWEEMSTAYTEVNRSRTILVDPNDENIIYAGFLQLYKSIDGGVTFNLLFDPVDTQIFNGIALDPANTDHLIAVDGFAGVMYRSLDAGMNWNTVASFAPANPFFIDKVRFDPLDSDRVYTGTYDYFWKSADNGATWNRVTNGLTTSDDITIDALLIDPITAGTVYIGTASDRVLKSVDFGDTWNITAYASDAGGDRPTRLLEDMAGNIYAFSGSGWKKSEDGGTTWQAQSIVDIESATINAKFTAQIDPLDQQRFLASDFDGIYIFENSIPLFDTSTVAVVDDNGGSAVAGDTFTYTVTVTNAGPANGNNVTLSIPIVDEMTYVPGSTFVNAAVVPDAVVGGVLTLDLGLLLPDGSVDVTYQVTADAQTAQHFATVTSDEDIAGTATNSVFINFPPVISNVATSATDTSVTVTWDTNEVSSSQIDYGPTATYGTFTAEFDTTPRVLSHSVEITNLEICTAYPYRILSTDASATQTVSSHHILTTTGCGQNGGGGGGGGGSRGRSRVLPDKSTSSTDSETGQETGDEDTPVSGSKNTRFGDISGHRSEQAIKTLECMEVISGRTSDRFVPDGKITRAELTKIALIIFGHPLLQDVTMHFPDVTENHWGEKYIATAQQAGIIRGYKDGRFLPDRLVTRAEAFQILLLAAGLEIETSPVAGYDDVPPDSWYFNLVNYVTAKKFPMHKPSDSFHPDEFITRGEMTEVAVKIFKFLQKENHKTNSSDKWEECAS